VLKTAPKRTRKTAQNATQAAMQPPVAATVAGWAALAAAAAVAATVCTTGAGDAAVGLALSRAGMDVTGVVVVGLALLGVLVPARHKQAPAVLARADRLVVIAAACWMTATTLVIVHRVANATGRPFTEVGVDQLISWSTALGAGQGLLLTAVAAALVFVGALVRLHRPGLVPPRALLGAAAFVMITPAVTGHSATADQFQVVSVIGIGVHVAAAAVWVGGLGALLVLVGPYRGLLVAVLPRFSQLATACIAGVTVTGVLTTAIHVGGMHVGAEHGGWDAGWAILRDSGWVLILFAKTAALAGIGAFGWLTRRRMAASRMPLLRWAGIEVALMAVALGLAAALTQAPMNALPG
jgi:putative copper resistance protein D